MLDAEYRHRELLLAGVELRRHPYPGQKWKHGWIPIAAAGLVDVGTGDAPDTPDPTTPADPPAERRAKLVKHIARWHNNLTDFDDLIDAVASRARNHGELQLGTSGRAHAFDASFGNGTRGVVTRYFGEPPGKLRASARHRAGADQMTSAMARAIGIPAPRVLRIAHEHSVSDPINGSPWDEREGLLTDAGIRMGLLDLLAGITVRDPGTIIIGPTGVIPAQSEDGWRPYDLARGGGHAPRPSKLRMREQVVTWSPFVNHGEWRKNPLTDADIEFLRERLGKLEPDFSHIGRPDWWRFISERLAAIAEHTGGTRNLFASG